MTEDDQVCDALAVCQQAVSGLPGPYKNAVVSAICRRQTHYSPPVVDPTKSTDRGSMGLAAGKSASSRAFTTCLETVEPLGPAARERVHRGLMTAALFRFDFNCEDPQLPTDYDLAHGTQYD